MAKLEDVEVTTASGLKTTYRVSPEDRKRFEEMSKRNEERQKQREERAERAERAGEETKVRQPRQRAAGGDVQTK